MCLYFNRKTMTKTTLVYESPFIQLYFVVLFSIEHCILWFYFRKFNYAIQFQTEMLSKFHDIFGILKEVYPVSLVYDGCVFVSLFHHKGETVNIEQYHVRSPETHLLYGIWNVKWMLTGIRKVCHRHLMLIIIWCDDEMLLWYWILN